MPFELRVPVSAVVIGAVRGDLKDVSAGFGSADLGVDVVRARNRRVLQHRLGHRLVAPGVVVDGPGRGVDVIVDFGDIKHVTVRRSSDGDIQLLAVPVRPCIAGRRGPAGEREYSSESEQFSGHGGNSVDGFGLDSSTSTTSFADVQRLAAL